MAAAKAEASTRRVRPVSAHGRQASAALHDAGPGRAHVGRLVVVVAAAEHEVRHALIRPLDVLREVHDVVSAGPQVAGRLPRRRSCSCLPPPATWSMSVLVFMQAGCVMFIRKWGVQPAPARSPAGWIWVLILYATDASTALAGRIHLAHTRPFFW